MSHVGREVMDCEFSFSLTGVQKATRHAEMPNRLCPTVRMDDRSNRLMIMVEDDLLVDCC